MALQTTESTSTTEPDSSRRDETERSWVSAVCDRAQFAADWAASTSTAACEAAATRTSSSSSEGRRPDAGSPTEKTPRMCPSEWWNGTNSSSCGCQAPGIVLSGELGTYRSPRCDSQSNVPCSMTYAPRRRNCVSMIGSNHSRGYVDPSSVSRASSFPWTLQTTKSSHSGR